MKKTRGRPRQYDSDAALEAATQVFWQQGFAGTTVDDIAAATQMSKPSLYAAFGEKAGIFNACLDRYNRKLHAELQSALNRNQGLKEDLTNFYRVALKRYNTNQLRLGCFTFSTTQPSDFRPAMADALSGLETLLEQRIGQAIDDGELQTRHDLQTLVALTSSVFLSLSIRVKSGQRRTTSRAAIRKYLEVIFGT